MTKENKYPAFLLTRQSRKSCKWDFVFSKRLNKIWPIIIRFLRIIKTAKYPHTEQ